MKSNDKILKDTIDQILEAISRGKDFLNGTLIPQGKKQQRSINWDHGKSFYTEKGTNSSVKTRSTEWETFGSYTLDRRLVSRILM